MSGPHLIEWLITLGVEAVVLALLVHRRAFRQFPLFSIYLAWTIASDILLAVLFKWFPNRFLYSYLYETLIDSALQLGVLVELAWSVLRPMRAMLPKWTLMVIAALILAAGAIVWPIAGITPLKELPTQWHYQLRLEQTVSILRVLFFVILAAGSQLLSLGWRDRELQIATGLGFFSLMGLIATFLHAQLPPEHSYSLVDQIFVVGAYMCALVYWGVSFLQREAPRQEFSPQMQSLLLRISGTAKANRIALENHSLPGDRRP